MTDSIYGGCTYTFMQAKRKQLKQLEEQWLKKDLNQSFHEASSLMSSIPELQISMIEDELKEVFYSWECISLYKSYGTTFDLVIKDPTIIMAFIHFIHKHLY